MTEVSHQIIAVAVGWLAYFVIHSLTASTQFKDASVQRLGLNSARYRLLYVVVSTVLLLPLAYLIGSDSTPMLWQHDGVVKIILNVISLLAIIGFVIVARSYNMISFLGLKTQAAQHGFKVSWLHRYVRHPWYFFGLIIIWTRDMSLLWLISCICITVYLIVGSWLEEKKLVTEFGEVYRYYQKQVPGLLMIPGRYISDNDLQKIERLKV